MPEADAHKKKLKEVQSDLRKQFPRATERLAQLDGALATAAMAVDHLYDEEARHQDLEARIAKNPELFLVHGHQMRPRGGK